MEELAESQCVFVSPLGKLKDTTIALAGIPRAGGHLGDLSINLSGRLGQIQNCNFACCLIWACIFVSHIVGGIRCRERHLDLTDIVEWRRLHNEEIHDLQSPNITRVIKIRIKMRGSCGMNGGGRCTQGS
jgi:hypothetical protein